ncbi:MAG: amidohydrolase family protein [Anaerolineales bacterium]|nr:amidohydrolase family protein [Anaerolineales bacterium]
MTTFPPRKLIDAHTHVMPKSLEYMKEVMQASNITKVVNLGVLESADIPFDEGMKAIRDVMGDRMVYFPAPEFDDVSPGFGERMAETLERKVEAGAGGLKIFKSLGLQVKDEDGKLIPVDDQRLDPLWSKAAELGVPVLIHSSDVLAHFQPLDENNEQFEALTRFPDWHVYGLEYPDHDELLEQRNRVIEHHPKTVFIGAHVGMYYEKLHIVDEWLDRYPNFYVDTSASIVQLGRYPKEEIQAFFRKHQDRILFGTDIVLGSFDELDDERPWEFKRTDYDYGIMRHFYETDMEDLRHPGYPVFGNWLVNGVDLPEELLDKFYSGNAIRLIPALQSD